MRCIRWLPLLSCGTFVALTMLSVQPATPPVQARERVDETKTLTSFVAKYCTHCHGAKKQEAELALHSYTDEPAIVKNRKTWLRVLDQVHAREMPPKGQPQPTDAERERFVEATKELFDRHDRTAKRDPGRVTMRRLNRAEYVNTIRDLVGVTIPLAEDFPADQAGHGFDNIGDALTLSPLQLERYLASADAIMKAAILVGEPPTPAKQQAPASQGFRGTPYGTRYDDRGRVARDDKGKMIPEKERLPALREGCRIFYDKGPLQKRFVDLSNAGVYQIVVRMQDSPLGDQPSKFAILVNDKEVASGTCTNTMESYLTTVRLKPGEIRVGVSLLNESTDPNDETKRRGIILESIAVVGPTIPESHERLLAGSEKLEGDAKSRFVLERFASRAYRRPATKEEIDRLMQIVKQAEKIPYYKMMPESFNKLQQAKVPGNVIGALKQLEKSSFCSEEDFTKLVKARLNADHFQLHVKDIFAAAEQIPQPWEARIALAMKAILCSPKFLFRVELDSRPTETETHPIDDYQLASRLSYFLWSSMPDSELFDLAAKKQLHQNLPAQVKRMLADPRAQALFDNFGAQWLGLRRLQEATPDPKLMPDFSKIRARGTWADLRGDMLTETRLFFTEIVRDNRSVLDLIDGQFTYVNQRLALLYDIGDTNGNSAIPKAKLLNPVGKPIPQIELLEAGQDEGTVARAHNPFVRVNLVNTPRGGLLTHASVLTVTSHPTQTSPVKRGQWVLEKILGTPPPPPPPDVGGFEQVKDAKTLTPRQQLELHRKNPNCAGCHARIDPLGFAFEKFNAIGKYREKDGDQPIDCVGELPGGKKVNGVEDLKTLIREKKDLVSRNLTEKLLTYAVGRGIEFYDRRTVDGVIAELQKNDYRMHTLILAIVQSDPFRMRRGKEKDQ